MHKTLTELKGDRLQHNNNRLFQYPAFKIYRTPRQKNNKETEVLDTLQT